MSHFFPRCSRFRGLTLLFNPSVFYVPRLNRVAGGCFNLVFQQPSQLLFVSKNLRTVPSACSVRFLFATETAVRRCRSNVSLRYFRRAGKRKSLLPRIPNNLRAPAEPFRAVFPFSSVPKTTRHTLSESSAFLSFVSACEKVSLLDCSFDEFRSNIFRRISVEKGKNTSTFFSLLAFFPIPQGRTGTHTRARGLCSV